MDCAAIAERSITKVTVRVVAVILWSRILVNLVSVMAVFWSPISRTTVLRAVHFLLAVVVARTDILAMIILAVKVTLVVVARTVYVAASRTVVGYVAVIVITVVTVIIVWAVNVNAALGSYVTHVVTVITAFIDIPVLR